MMKQLLQSSRSLATKVSARYDDMGRKAHISMMLALGAVLTTFPELSHAQTPSLGDVGKNAGDQSSGLTSGALRLAGFVGIVMVIIAFVKGRNAKQQGESIGAYVGMGIVGALLLAVPVIISIVNVSFLGSDASQTIQGQIIQ
jgi:hypothetical protein